MLAFFGGTICNRIGVRLTLALGCFGYALYVAAFLAYNHINSRADPFVIVAGTIEGISAGLLWTAHGAIVMSYPTEEDKGKLFALCWAIFNFGSVVGSVISVALNWSNTTNSVTDGTYIAFLVIMLLGCLLPFLLCKEARVVRKDSTKVVMPIHPTWKSEFVGLWKVLRMEYWICLSIFPFFFSSNWVSVYQDNDYNGGAFTIRTRSVNGLLRQSGAIVGTLIIGFYSTGNASVDGLEPKWATALFGLSSWLFGDVHISLRKTALGFSTKKHLESMSPSHMEHWLSILYFLEFPTAFTRRMLTG